MMLTEAALALYLFLMRDPNGRAEQSAGGGIPETARPQGRLIWLIAGTADAVPEVVGLIAALCESGVAASYLVTLPERAFGQSAEIAIEGRRDWPEGVIFATGPAEAQGRIRAFLGHWRPDAAAFVGGPIRPSLIHQLHLRDVPLFLFGAGAPRLAPVAPGWLPRILPGLIRGSLRRVTRILSRGPDAARALIRSGAPAYLVETAGALQDGTGPMPHAEAEREAMAQLFGPRPVWLAVNVPEAEEQMILAAHETAQRLSHRLLLVLSPDDPGRGPALAERLEHSLSQRIARRGAEAYPDEETSVYIADTEDELGLWFRMATLTFFGGTLTRAASALDPGPHPFAAASLGSAVLFGPEIPLSYRVAFADLAKAQAARMVRSSNELAEAIGELLAPDKAAVQALNAWQVISDRDATTERAVRLLRDALPPDLEPAVPEKARP
jgi:3-deoxy-D-manno-octulosonic-acid transferase